jgi:ABC-2 type transport system ATP-binding protein
MQEEIAVRIENVSKDFVLPHEKVSSVKGLFTGLSKGLSHTKETQHALKNIDFEIKKGEFFGIVGRNGSGKSTLLKILAGIYQPTKGRVYTQGKLVPFIELGVGFNPELTGRENVYLNGALLGFSEREIDAMYNDIVAFAELERFMDQKLKNYSSGMQVRLAFSVATRAQAEVLLIDEVLAVGDAAFQRKCYEYFKELKAKHTTVVFVTHDMSAVREFCDRGMLIDNSKVKSMGSPQDIAQEYSQLFIDEDPIETHTTGSKRWGNGGVRIDDVKIMHGGDHLKVDVNFSVHNKIDRVIYGLHILGQDGAEITAMNNRMIHAPDIEGIEPGEKIKLEWDVLNIFNDGKYFVNVTLVDDTAQTLDWITRAASFTIRRSERSTTAVLPPVKVKFEKGGK